MHPLARIAVLLLLAAATQAWPQTARAEIHRCLLPSGQHVYSDRRCVDLGAVRRLPDHDAVDTGRASLYRGRCSASLRDLKYALLAAINSHDVNALAALYHWPGMSTAGATATMRRLNAIVQRPLVDIQAIAQHPPVAFNAGEQRPDTPRRVTGLRIHQTASGSVTPLETEFHLRRYRDCWWLHF